MDVPRHRTLARPAAASAAAVKLFVDGEQKSTAKLRFPKVTER